MKGRFIDLLSIEIIFIILLSDLLTSRLREHSCVF